MPIKKSESATAAAKLEKEVAALKKELSAQKSAAAAAAKELQELRARLDAQASQPAQASTDPRLDALIEILCDKRHINIRSLRTAVRKLV